MPQLCWILAFSVTRFAEERIGVTELQFKWVPTPGEVFRISGERLLCERKTDARIVIADVSGRSVVRFVVDRSTGMVRLPHLPPGVYCVKIASGRSGPRTLRWVSLE